MARKALLTENEIRQFMKLARLDPVGNTRLQEFGTVRERGEEEELEDEFGMPGSELGAEDPMADEEDAELDDLETDLDIADETDVGGGLEPELEDMLAQGVEALAAAWGIEDRVAVEGGEGGDEDLDAPLPDEEEEMSLGMGMEPTDDLEAAAGEEEEEEELPGSRMYETLSDDQIVQEVAKRVVARLAASQKKENLSEDLAARILKRLTSKQA
jgi:hypothetical protein